MHIVLCEKREKARVGGRGVRVGRRKRRGESEAVLPGCSPMAVYLPVVGVGSMEANFSQNNCFLCIISLFFDPWPCLNR